MDVSTPTRRPAIVVMGSMIMDIIVETPHLPRRGENIHAHRVTASAGGKGANAAVAWTRLGGHAYLISNVGADLFGREMLRVLQEEGVDVRAVGVVPDTPTGAGVLLVDPSGETSFIIAAGANMTLKAEEGAARLKPLLAEVDGLLFNFEIAEEALLQAVRLAEEAKVPIFVDAGPARPYSPRLWRHAEILSPNRTEAEALVGFRIREDADARAAASALLSQGPRAVVLKLDARGALLATQERMTFFPAFPIRPVDAAGAGDAFTAGLVWARLQGWPWERAMTWASACGALAAARLGAMRAAPRREEVMAFLATHQTSAGG